jgi:hypothetical protein
VKHVLAFSFCLWLAAVLIINFNLPAKTRDYKTKIMKEFMLFFRQPSYDYNNVSPKEMQALTQKWQDWVGGIVAQGKLSTNGQRLATEGKVLRKGGVITDGPFVEIRERLGSFITVKAENIEEALTLAHGCPALDADGSVEVRPIFQ